MSDSSFKHWPFKYDQFTHSLDISYFENQVTVTFFEYNVPLI